MPSFDHIFKDGPVVVLVRNPENPWEILSFSENVTRLGITPLSPSFDQTSYVNVEDLDANNRKMGAGIMQKRPSVLLRYRVLGGIHVHWVEDYCSLTYNPDGSLASVESILWITTLPLEWHLLCKGSLAWNTLNSKLRHDILNQLTAILGYLELSTDMVDDPMLKDFTAKEQKAAERIREKLIFSREYQKIGLTENEWVNISSLLTEAVGEAGCRNLLVDMKVPDIKIFSDKVLKQAFIRILENTVIHAPEATKMMIRFIRFTTGGILTLEDNGPGIPEEQKNRIFDLGFGAGDGFGLFLAEKLLHIFGITISEKGVFGSGARFELTIPGEILHYS
jgi:two-component sensor histidine kinase